MNSSSETGWTLTAYCPCQQCCGKSDGITACGYRLTPSDALKVCAAPSTFEFNQRLRITEGWTGNVVVKDRGGAIKGKRLDIWLPTHQEALAFGRKNNCTVEKID